MAQGDNNIKEAGEGYALQATKMLKSGKCKFVSGENVPRRPSVYTVAIDDIVLVFDDDRVSDEDRTEIVLTAARDGNVLGCAGYSHVQQSGNGYQVNLPADVIESAGHYVGMNTGYSGTDGLILICPKSTPNTSLVRGIRANRAAQAGVGEVS